MADTILQWGYDHNVWKDPVIWADDGSDEGASIWISFGEFHVWSQDYYWGHFADLEAAQREVERVTKELQPELWARKEFPG